MTHTALARRYRPKRFSELVAQDHVAAGLTGAIVKQRVAHAYLLTGPRGVGKTTAARVLAMALNCERRESENLGGEPCAECDSCRRIWSGAANLDVVEIDAASNRGVDDARELRERAMYAASGPHRYKVYIVDEAHMLTREAWNALLKILEEPPPRVVFVFATTEPQKIANTAAPVLSRLQRFDFRRIGPQAIVERLRHVADAEGISVEHDALVLLARVANGGMRDALSLLDQAVAFGEGPVTAERVRASLGLIADDAYAELLAMLAARRADGVFPFVERLVESGADLMEFVNGLGELLRALLLTQLGGEVEGLTESLRDVVRRHAEAFRPGDVLRMLKFLADAENAVRRSPNARLHVEALLVQWALLDRTVDLEEVLGALGVAPKGTAGAGAAERAGEAKRLAAAKSVEESSAPAAPPTPALPLTLDRLRALWADVIEMVGQRRRMAREALAHAAPRAVEGDRVTLAVRSGDVYLEGLERSRDLVTEAVSRVTGTPVRIAFVTEDAAAGDAPPGTARPPRRLDEATDRNERLNALRAKDPALDRAADALDLELLE